MKNEQTNNQTGKQGQDVKNAGNNQTDENQQQGQNKPAGSTTGKTDQSSAQKSNITVDNEGKIGKAHDQWNNGNQNNNRNENNQAKSDKTVTEPEIDSPIYDPEKTEKKIPQMENNKNKK